MSRFEEVEETLFDRFGPRGRAGDVPAVFILGAPRTGSTLLYQLMVNCFDFFYFSNLVNDEFASFPVVGAALQRAVAPSGPVSYESRQGKTPGFWGPSEASLVFRNWFGGEHPSQVRSRELLPGKRDHFLMSMATIHALYGLPVLTKNAWNCFRIRAIVELLPAVGFIWIRRDICSSAVSDLKSRYERGGPCVWNSATTANYREIQRLPYWEQVVEQQYEYTRAIRSGLDSFAPSRHVEVWYEDLCRDALGILRFIQENLVAWGINVKRTGHTPPTLEASPGPGDIPEDRRKIEQYVEQNLSRLADCVFHPEE